MKSFVVGVNPDADFVEFIYFYLFYVISVELGIYSFIRSNSVTLMLISVSLKHSFVAPSLICNKLSECGNLIA